MDSIIKDSLLMYNSLDEVIGSLADTMTKDVSDESKIKLIKSIELLKSAQEAIKENIVYEKPKNFYEL